MADLIQFRRDTLERWNSFNPTLAEGELGLVLGKANQYKVGDGIHAWNDLPMKGFNGNILEELGENYDAVISQHGMNKLLKYIINNGSQVEVGTNWKILDSITNAGVYIITRDGLPVHHMIVCWDYMMHQYNQWIFGNLTINSDGGVNGTYTDGTANIIHRSKGVESSATWSRWKYLQEYFLKEEKGRNSHYSVSQKFFTETIDSLSDDMAAMEIELKKEFSSQNIQLQNAINSLQTKFDNLNARTDYIEDSTNTALNDAKEANDKAEECASDISDIGKRIEALENNARITLSVTPSVIHRNTTTSITIRANAYGFVPESFSITYNDTDIASEEGKTSVTATIEASSSVTLSAKAIYGGRNYTASASVKAVGVIYYGFKNDTENVTKTLSPRTSALGNYQLESTLDNAKFFIMIPSDMSFPSSITMGGTPYVMDMTETEKDGEAYYLLTSGATYNAGAEININLS